MSYVVGEFLSTRELIAKSSDDGLAIGCEGTRVKVLADDAFRPREQIASSLLKPN
jgi:hypothetical protein